MFTAQKISDIQGNTMTTFTLTTSLFDRNLPPIISHDETDGHRDLLIAFDLHNSLPYLESGMAGFGRILDIHLLESIAFLGKYHRKYFKGEQDIPIFGLRKYIADFVMEGANGYAGIPNILQDFWPRAINYALKLKARAETKGGWNHYRTVELPFSLSLYHLTQNGIKADPARITEIRAKIKSAQEKLYLALDINNVDGVDIKHLNDWVKEYGFDEYFPAGRDEISMKDLSLLEDRHQVFKIFLRIDKLKRIKNILNSFGNRTLVRPFYKTLGTVTGRCTSTNPNMMGIPKIFRPIVVPSRKNYGIVECDYSQMEVGVAAALSGDRNLVHDFNIGDVYEKTGEWLFGRDSLISRNKAKIIFLGIQYGLSKNTLAKRLGLDRNATDRILETLYSRYAKLSEYLKHQQKNGERNGYVTNVSGLKRYRRNPGYKPNYWENNWFRNFPVQASAASVFKRAISKMHQKLKNRAFNLLVPLYDSVVFEAPLNQLSEITAVVKDCMIESMTDYFPMLNAKVTVNDADPSCWNSEGNSNSITTFLNDPLSDIDIREKPSSNVDWSKYL